MHFGDTISGFLSGISRDRNYAKIRIISELLGLMVIIMSWESVRKSGHRETDVTGGLELTRRMRVVM